MDVPIDYVNGSLLQFAARDWIERSKSINGRAAAAAAQVNVALSGAVKVLD